MIDYILSLYKEGKKEFKDDKLLSTCINAGWAKMNKYYMLTEDTLAYATAVILNPANKWGYFKKIWEDQVS